MKIVWNSVFLANRITYANTRVSSSFIVSESLRCICSLFPAIVPKRETEPDMHTRLAHFESWSFGVSRSRPISPHQSRWIRLPPLIRLLTGPREHNFRFHETGWFVLIMLIRTFHRLAIGERVVSRAFARWYL